jgi:hypothetical protein
MSGVQGVQLVVNFINLRSKLMVYREKGRLYELEEIEEE